MYVDEWLRRLPEGATAERDLVSQAFAMPERFRETSDAPIRANGRLSENGRAEEIQAAAKGGYSEHLGQLKTRASNWAADVQNARLNLRPKAPDKSDLFSESQRQEVRTYLRTLSPADRLRAALENPEITEAVVHGSHFLSGLEKDQHERIVSSWIERERGETLKQIKQREEVVAVVVSAVETAYGQLAREAGLKRSDLDA